MPYQVMVQLPGTACRVPADVLRAECTRNGAVQQVLLRYTDTLVAQLSQAPVCHRFHSASQRLSRFLLVARDRASRDTLELTHEFIAYMLGLPRSGITAAAVALQDRGLIRYRHGRITVIQ